MKAEDGKFNNDRKIQNIETELSQKYDEDARSVINKLLQTKNAKEFTDKTRSILQESNNASEDQKLHSKLKSKIIKLGILVYNDRGLEDFNRINNSAYLEEFFGIKNPQKETSNIIELPGASLDLLSEESRTQKVDHILKGGELQSSIILGGVEKSRNQLLDLAYEKKAQQIEIIKRIQELDEQLSNLTYQKHEDPGLKLRAEFSNIVHDKLLSPFLSNPNANNENKESAIRLSSRIKDFLTQNISAIKENSLTAENLTDEFLIENFQFLHDKPNLLNFIRDGLTDTLNFFNGNSEFFTGLNDDEFKHFIISSMG
jgi:hypothetical protein